ncbi:MAG: NAD-dependent epimerase/dehydratase family protein [Microcoleaceae cyanobacterium MO_207.B10]|nr:NAD-dependent epimerase/dehydratase family protein [Microcoleaceae cyanobacterium MO_207.B10]
MHIIITGGAGFIGSHLSEFILEKGHQITVIDNLKTGKLKNLLPHPNLNLIQKDILTCQPTDFPKSINGIVHLAATYSVNTSWQKPLETHQNNLSSTLAVIELCHALKIPKLVFASSATVYGNPINLPVTESHPTQPLSPYGLHKLCSEQYLNLFAQKYNFAAVNLRFFNVFGSRKDPNSPYSGVISIFVERMKQGLPITIFGDGKQTRDFIYVKDIANGLYQALIKPIQPGSSLTCNLGRGQKTSLLELINILKNCFPQWIYSVNFAPARLGDIIHSQADISIALSELGFKTNWDIESAFTHFLNSQK